MKDDKPNLDSYVRAYHIRRLDNRVRVSVSGHMGMLESGRHYYVSLEVLTGIPTDKDVLLSNSMWHHVRGSTLVGMSEEHAMDLMNDRYREAEVWLVNLIPEWFLANFPKLAKKAAANFPKMAL